MYFPQLGGANKLSPPRSNNFSEVLIHRSGEAPNVSLVDQHLARLRNDDLVKTRREAQTIFYSLAGGEAAAVIETLCRLYGAGSAHDGQVLMDAQEGSAGTRTATAQ